LGSSVGSTVTRTETSGPSSSRGEPPVRVPTEHGVHVKGRGGILATRDPCRHPLQRDPHEMGRGGCDTGQFRVVEEGRRATQTEGLREMEAAGLGGLHGPPGAAGGGALGYLSGGLTGLGGIGRDRLVLLVSGKSPSA